MAWVIILYILYTKRCRCQKTINALINPLLYEKNGHFVFLSPSSGGLGAMYAVGLRLIGKPIVDFLKVIIMSGRP